MTTEYWINAYDFSGLEPKSKNTISFGRNHDTRESAVKAATYGITWPQFVHVPCYRIHVILKENHEHV